MNAEPPLDRSLIPPGSRVLCAVSGGADSMCLLHMLFTGRDELGIQVLAAHFEHGLRGEESLRDARFVESYCGEQGIPFYMGRGDVRAYAEKSGMGLEEAARELRYAFLEKTAAEQGCDTLATAHNADDNAETVIFKLCRGSAGIRGIPPRRGRIVRPLLGATRREIEEYLLANQLPHVEDSSNASDDYSRNLIRHQVSPVLRRLNPEYTSAIARAAALSREDDDCLMAMARKFIDTNFRENSLPDRELSALHRALASRVIRALCPRPLEQSHVDMVLRLCGRDGLAWADLPGLRIRHEQGRLYFTDPERAGLGEYPIAAGERTVIPEAGLVFSASEEYCSEEINDLFKTYCFKYDNICGNIICTGRRAGDSIHPAGRNCGKTLKSLFMEAGMTQRQRDLTPVLRDDGGILAVYGLAVDIRTLPQPGDRVLRIEIEKI